ncbi:MAG TPA: hypothetical protein VGG83_10730 [Trebonia sp.]
MSTYRYITTNILTGQVMGDSLPLVVNSASRLLSGVGRASGHLPLQGVRALDLGSIQALTPRKAVLWILQDGYPVWGGWLLDTPHESILDNQLPFSAVTIEGLLQYRLITGGLSFTNTDVFDIARSLVQYATSPSIGPNAQIAGLSYMSGESGTTDTLTFGVSNTLQAGGDSYYGTFSDEQQVLDALTGTATADGFEFTFEPQPLPMGAFGWLLRLGYPALGQYNASPPVQAFNFPGNVINYARPTMGSNGANWLVGTSAANGSGATYNSGAPYGVDNIDLDNGLPLQQVAVTWPGVGVTSQAQINQYVQALLGQYTAGTMLPSVVLGGGTAPLLRTIGLGDSAAFAASSSLDPADPVTGAPGLQITGRVTGWELVPPAENQTEKVTVTLGALLGSSSQGAIGQVM